MLDKNFGAFASLLHSASSSASVSCSSASVSFLGTSSVSIPCPSPCDAPSSFISAASATSCSPSPSPTAPRSMQTFCASSPSVPRIASVVQSSPASVLCLSPSHVTSSPISAASASSCAASPSSSPSNTQSSSSSSPDVSVVGFVRRVPDSVEELSSEWIDKHERNAFMVNESTLDIVVVDVFVKLLNEMKLFTPIPLPSQILGRN